MTDKTDEVLKLALDVGHIMLDKYNETQDGYALAEQLCLLLIVLAAIRSGAESEAMFKLNTALDTAMSIIKSRGGTQAGTEPGRGEK